MRIQPRALRFYTDGLGFEVAETFTAGDEVAPLGEITSGAKMTSQTIVKDGVRLELLWWPEPGCVGTPSTQRNQLGLTHLSFVVDDIADTEPAWSRSVPRSSNRRAAASTPGPAPSTWCS